MDVDDAPQKPDDFLETAKRRFKLAVEAMQQQAERELEDLKFQVPEEQWTEKARRMREGDEYAPGRPTLSISKIDQPIQLVVNTAKNARLGVEIHPVSEDADDDTAEVLTGIYRRIERDSNAQDARMWALSRAVICGRGFYRVGTKYDEDSPDTWDQEITIERIPYQDSVYLDPSAIKPDWSDGEFAFVPAWLSRSEFKRQFPKARLSSANEMEWEATARNTPGWVKATTDPSQEAVLVAEYWYKQHETEKVTIEVDGVEQSRSRDTVTVYCCKINGDEMLEEPQLWPGRYIPIIPALGKELQPYDGQRRFTGMVANAKDGQRFYNFAASSLVERMQLEPKAPFIGYEGQFEGHEKKWDTVNIKNHPYLEVKPIALDGKPVPLPERSQVSTQGMSVAMAALQEADGFINATMQAGYAPDIGKFPARERSGRAIRALQDQLETGTSNYITDFARNSMGYEARVILDLIPAIYDRPGRITQVLGEEGDSEPKMLGVPFKMNPETGQPMPTEQGAPGSKFYDLARGRYTVTVSVGRSQQSRREEGREEMSQLLEAQSELWPVLGPTFLKFMDAPWAKEASDLLKKFRDKKFPELAAGDDEERSPEETAARLAAAEDYIKQIQGQLKEAQAALETDQAKQQATLQKAQLDMMTKLKTTEMQTQSRLQEAEMDAQVKLLIQAMDERFEALQKRLERLQSDKETARATVEKTAEAELKFGPAQGPLTTDDTLR